MTNLFGHAHYSIEHAKRHIENVEREFEAWGKTYPYAAFVEPNADGTEDIHKVKLTKPLPVALPGIVFDALGNLRAALDQAGYATATASGKSGKKAKFPFGDTEAEVKSRVHSQSKEIPQEVFDVMVALQPYKTGNVTLWALNKLCNTNKHEITIPLPLITYAPGVTGDGFFGGRVIELIWPPKWEPSKNEMIVARLERGSNFNYQLQIAASITMGKVHGVAGKPVPAVLNEMLTMVEDSLMAIEAEARRIGLTV
jgi:hypothetical protein